MVRKMIGKTIFAWEQFKKEAEAAQKMFENNNTKWFVVFVPSLKQFNATAKPHGTDETVLIFGGDMYEHQKVILHDLVTTFDAWYEFNSYKL